MKNWGPTVQRYGASRGPVEPFAQVQHEIYPPGRLEIEAGRSCKVVQNRFPPNGIFGSSEYVGGRSKKNGDAATCSEEI